MTETKVAKYKPGDGAALVKDALDTNAAILQPPFPCLVPYARPAVCVHLGPDGAVVAVAADFAVTFEAVALRDVAPLPTDSNHEAFFALAQGLRAWTKDLERSTKRTRGRPSD